MAPAARPRARGWTRRRSEGGLEAPHLHGVDVHVDVRDRGGQRSERRGGLREGVRDGGAAAPGAAEDAAEAASETARTTSSGAGYADARHAARGAGADRARMRANRRAARRASRRRAASRGRRGKTPWRAREGRGACEGTARGRAWRSGREGRGGARDRARTVADAASLVARGVKTHVQQVAEASPIDVADSTRVVDGAGGGERGVRRRRAFHRALRSVDGSNAPIKNEPIPDLPEPSRRSTRTRFLEYGTRRDGSRRQHDASKRPKAGVR